MNKLLIVCDLIEYKEWSYYKSFRIKFFDEIIGEWCLRLCLLEQDIVKNFKITDSLGRYIFTIYKAKSIDKQRYKIFRKKRIDIYVFEIGYWAYYFLKYYKNGVGDVNHIHGEFVSCRKKTKKLDLELEVCREKPPLTRKQMNKHLGLSGKLQKAELAKDEYFNDIRNLIGKDAADIKH